MPLKDASGSSHAAPLLVQVHTDEHLIHTIPDT